jgi:glutathione peroxidase
MSMIVAGAMKTVFRAAAVAAVAVSVTAFLAAKGRAEGGGPPLDWSAQNLTSIKGEPYDAAALEGRVVLLVNTASRCAFTPQYEGLERLWDDYARSGFTVLGVPSNDFGNQEPGSNEEIANFCSSTYDVSFPMLEKAKVTGPDAHPLFQWARRAGGRDAIPGWNFHKVLIGRDGAFVAGFPSYVSPRSPQVMGAVEKALATPAL